MTKEEQAILSRLSARLTRDDRRFKVLNAYYNGEQTFQQLGIAVPPELDSLVTIMNMCRLGINGLDARLSVEGFRYDGDEKADKEMWRIWQANNLDGESQLGRLDALIYGRSYLCVGANEDDRSTPLITVETPREMVHEYDPRLRKVTAAARFYRDIEGKRFATLYLPDVTIWLRSEGRGWVEYDRDEHKLGVVPVVPLVNRARIEDRYGLSEMSDLISITDAAARALTNLQVAQETHALPQRGVLGATASDFKDKDGNDVSTWEAYFGRVWTLANEKAKTFQFDGSDLRNFHETIELYLRLASAITYLPPSYFGLAADDAASADAIRSREAQLNKWCERKQDAMSDPYEDTQRIAILFKGKKVPRKALSLETMWRDPATPTKAQTADAVVKLTQTSPPIMPREMAWEEIGWGPTKRDRAKQMFAEQETDPVLEGFIAGDRGGNGQQLTLEPDPALAATGAASS